MNPSTYRVCPQLGAGSDNHGTRISPMRTSSSSTMGFEGLPRAAAVPIGVAVDTDGDIFKADYENHWVSIFSSEGKFKTKIGAGCLTGPKGVAIEVNGHIIVFEKLLQL